MYNRIVNHYQDSKRNFKLFSAIIGLLLIVAAYKIYSDVFSPNVAAKYESDKAYIFVHSKKDFNQFLSGIEKEYLLKNGDSFRRLAKLINLNNKLKPGRYELKAGMSNWDIIKILIKGQQQPLDITFKYAERKVEIARFFATHLEADSTSLNTLLSDSLYALNLGFDTNTIACVFIPNTYNFYWNTGSIGVFERMFKEYKKFWNASRLTLALQCRLTPVQVSVLASIVQKESNKGDEMPLIAGVYLNRLRINMSLQADPTIVYALNDKNIRRVTRVHTAYNSPYNTYLNVGLPPGPICTPSIQAIDAVLNYKRHQYIYFCAKEDFSGYHVFSETLEQHNQNARRYQRALNANGIR
ncbi:MAG: endolytic transglycosylase MltG [Bacteroidia bacterium]|nr:endolytic transglycosylase MltG [Bacteroidia bacterium]